MWTTNYYNFLDIDNFFYQQKSNDITKGAL